MPLTASDVSRLYDSYAAPLVQFFARRTFDPEAAVDLVAVTFAAAFEDRAKFRGRGPESEQAWLHAIARRRLLDFYRRKYVEQRTLRKLGVERRALTDLEYERIEDLAASRPLREAVGQALLNITQSERDLLRLRVVEERPYQEVARELGITEQAARARVSRALRGLRQSNALIHLHGGQ